MAKYRVDVASDLDPAPPAHGEAKPGADPEATENSAAQNGNVVNTDALVDGAVVVGAVVVGAAIFEAALIPGILLGAAAVVAPKVFPKLGERMEPLFNTAVRGVYKAGRKARAIVGEAQERMGDIAAELDAEEAGAGQAQGESGPAPARA